MEKILRFLLFITFVLGSITFASAKDHFLDEDFKQYEESYWAEMEKCWKLRTNREQIPCEEKVDLAFDNDPRERGSEAYVHKHYTSLGYAAMEEKLLELKVLQKKAPSYEMNFERPHGVLSKQIFGSEISFLQQILAEGALAADCRKMQQTNEKLGLSADQLPPACQQYFREKAMEEKLGLH